MIASAPVASSMTWLLVRMRPLASNTNPEPTPVDGIENGPKPCWPAASVVMVTTAGLADSATAMTASLAVMASGALDAAAAGVVAAGGRRQGRPATGEDARR